MKGFWKKGIFFSCFVTACLCVPAVFKRITCGFKPSLVLRTSAVAGCKGRAIDDGLRRCLGQPFAFLGKGAQSYVFESKDGKCVLKVFRKVEGEQLQNLFLACQLAHDRLQGETGLLYVHLEPTPKQLGLARCRDGLGRVYELPLDECCFVLQKKAVGLREALLSCRGNPKRVKERLLQVMQLIQTRASKGICNTDVRFVYNTGFVGDEAIEFDFGRYTLGGKSQLELENFCNKMSRWMEREMPENAYLLKELKDVSNSF